MFHNNTVGYASVEGSNSLPPTITYTKASVGAMPLHEPSEIDQELNTYEGLLLALDSELAMIADKLSPVLAAGKASNKESDPSLPRNSTIARRLNSSNCTLNRLIEGFRSIRIDVQL